MPLCANAALQDPVPWHIRGAVKLHWRDVQDPVERDLVEKDAFEQLMAERGISNGTTLVL